MHPAVLALGLRYADGTIKGSTARCAAMVNALCQVRCSSCCCWCCCWWFRLWLCSVNCMCLMLPPCLQCWFVRVSMCVLGGCLPFTPLLLRALLALILASTTSYARNTLVVQDGDECFKRIVQAACSTSMYCAGVSWVVLAAFTPHEQRMRTKSMSSGGKHVNKSKHICLLLSP